MALLLDDCFVFAGLNMRDRNPETILEAKKIIFLELKSSGEDTIEIAGNVYTKNDLLQFFDQYNQSEQSENSTSKAISVAVQEHSSSNWHHVLAKPELLNAYFDLPDELLDPNKMLSAKKQVELVYGKGILMAAQRFLRDQQFDQLHFILSYNPVFSEGFSYDIKQALIVLFRNWVLKTEAIIQTDNTREFALSLPFHSKGFYATIHFLKDVDYDITRTVIRLAVDSSKGQGLSWEEKIELFEALYQLPLDDESEAYLVRNLKFFNQRISDQQSSTGSTTSIDKQSNTASTAKKEEPSAWRGFIYLMIILVGGYFGYLKLWGGKKDKPDYSKEMALMDEQFKGTYYDQKDVISNYESIVASLNENVSNRGMRNLLLNQLSLFCFNRPENDSTFLTVERMKAIPGCVPMSFANYCEDYEILVLAYNEEKPLSKPRALLVAKDTTVDCYILPTDRVIVLPQPQVDGFNVFATRAPSMEFFNCVFESYRLKNGKPKADVHLSISSYDLDYISLIHIYETMNFKRLSRQYKKK